MRITFLVPGLDRIGGTERSVVNLANALVDHGQDVRLISVVREQQQPRLHIDPRVEAEFLVSAIPDHEPGVLVGEPPDPATCERLAAAPSLLIPADWDPRFSALTDLGLETRLPTVGTDVLVTVSAGLLAAATQLAPAESALVHLERRPAFVQTPGTEPLLTFGARADIIVCPTHDLATLLRSRLGECAPRVVVAPSPLSSDSPLPSPLDQPLIVAAGRIDGQKQYVRLIRVFEEIAARVPQWRLRILGDGSQLPLLRRQIRKSRLWDRVELPGETDNMESEWARAGIGALTSREVVLPPVVQEAMAAGVPVAAFDAFTGPRDLIEHEVNGLLVPAGSDAAMAAALLRLATDEPLRRRLGAAARESALHRFAPAPVAAQWLDILTEAVARRADSRLVGRAVERTPEASAGVDRGEPGTGQAVAPTTARTAALSLLSSIAGRCGSEWFVIPPDGDGPATVALPISQRDRFLSELAESPLPPYLSLLDPGDHRWPVRRGEPGSLATELRRGRTSRIVVEPWPSATVEFNGQTRVPSLLSQGCAVSVEFWSESITDHLVSPGHTRLVASVPPGTTRTRTTIHDVEVQTLPPFTGRLAHECGFPVDVVYTWVDGGDPEWNLARLRHLHGAEAASREDAASGRARYQSRDELRYSMRSLHLFAPWVRTIHLVTAGQVPQWLDLDHPKVELVDHSEILPGDALPTFNSHAIETALHHVPDLTEHFIYFNDDVFLGRPARPEMFFSAAGAPSVFLSRHPIGLPQADDPPYLHAAGNNQRLLLDALGARITQTLGHTPHPHRRSMLLDIEQRFAGEVDRTAHARFRSDSDISIMSSMAQHFGLLTGRAVTGDGVLGYTSLAAATVFHDLRALLDRDQDFFCLGDHHHHAARPGQLATTLHQFLEAYFPVAAPWEHSEG